MIFNFKRFLSLFTFGLFFSAYSIAQPINDNYASAIDVTSLLGTCSANAAYTTTAATSDLNTGTCWNNLGPRQNVWFKFTAPSTGEINVTVDRGGVKGSQRATQLALWKDDGVTEIGCDRYDFYDEDVVLEAVGLTPGLEYYISVDVYHSIYGGTFTLCTDTVVGYDFYEGAIDNTPLTLGLTH